MANNDYNMIKPVEGLPNVKGITAAKHHEQRKKRQDLHEQEQHDQKDELTEDELSESTEEKNDGREIDDNNQQRDSVDYCA